MLFRKPPVPPIWLDEFFDALKNAVLGANRLVRDQHIDSLNDLYDVLPAADGGSGEPTYVPKVVRMRIPPNVLPAEGGAPPVDVPLATLVQHDALVLGEMTFDFECRVTQYEPGENGGQGRVAIRLERDGAGSPARISLKYRINDPPEAVARINDALLRTFS
jgi:hypothetical protein